MTNQPPKGDKGVGPERAPNKKRVDKILAGLSEVQRRATIHIDGPMVVFAGAGSGKTRIITHRIAYLIEQGIKPDEILAVTFTNKAAGEMRQRVEQITPFASRCVIATFHSACARWLREFASELGFTSDFSIYDEADSLQAIKMVLGELEVKLEDEVTAQEYRSAINKMKTMALLPNDERLLREYNDLLPPVGAKVYKRYQEYLAQCNAMDFGDLIMNMLLLFRRNQHVTGVLQSRYRHVLVDEYQDTNRTQFELIARLTEKSQNLFVVGDDDQSIYSWRGAVPTNIIEFDKIYANAKKVTMEQNYRCSGAIVKAANAMIRHNKKRVEKQLFTNNPLGHLIEFRLESDNELEAWWVIDKIKQERSSYDLPEIAIFYRTNSQSRSLEDALRRENIPYQIYGTVRFYDRVEVKDLMAYLRVLINPFDNMSVKRVLNVPLRGLGQKAEEVIEAEAIKRNLPMIKTMEIMVSENYPKIATKIKVFLNVIEGLKKAIFAAPMDHVIEILLNVTGYKDYVVKKFPEQALDKIENIHELAAAITDFASAYPQANIAEWLQSVTLSSSVEGQKGGVSMMTLHMAKGLEFKRVYIVGLEEGLLPHRSSLESNSELEEERRLCYVGMTRAKEKLSLLGANRRRTYTQWAANRPSRFLAEIPADLLMTLDVNQNYRAYDRSTSFNEVYEYEEDPPLVEGQPGQNVYHPTYGKGVIEQVVRETGGIKAVVQFAEFGLRKVVMHHLSLTKDV